MWDAFKDAIFWCIDAMYGFVADWGLAIIIVTLILRLILFPLMQKQIRSSYRSSSSLLCIQEIQEKYADDQQRPGRGNAEGLCRDRLQPHYRLLASVPSDAYLRCPVPGIAGNGLPYRRHDLLLL